MSGDGIEDSDDDDGFWQVAFMAETKGLEQYHYSDSDDEDDSDDKNACRNIIGGKTTTYKFPNTSVTMRLAELPAVDGVWSPVGADAWYASALLTCLILQEVDAKCRDDTTELAKIFDIDTTIAQKRTFRVLELGSGTKALPGFAAAISLSAFNQQLSSWSVRLTDNDKDCLEQLKANVQANESKIIWAEGNLDKQINVKYVDWRDDFNSSDKSSLLQANVVIGSELVYTKETAHALVNILTKLLVYNDAIDIWIVQVTDRSGWQEIVVPAMEAHPEVTVETIPLTWHIHEMACSMIPMGGALDRHAFGAYHFSKGR